MRLLHPGHVCVCGGWRRSTADRCPPEVSKRNILDDYLTLQFKVCLDTGAVVEGANAASLQKCLWRDDVIRIAHIHMNEVACLRRFTIDCPCSRSSH